MDIVERLRNVERYEDAWNICDEAADEIERLRKALQLVRRYVDSPAIEKALGEKE